MTMMFQTVKARLVEILGDNAGGLFRVVGYQPRHEGAEETKLTSRVVRVFFDGGEFPKSASSPSGPIRHNMTFGVLLVVSAPAEGDVLTLEDPTASAAAKAVALTGFQAAADLADEKFDDLVMRVYQILMDNRYQWLDNSEALDGSADIAVADRWVGRVDKDEPSPYGSLVTITGSFQFTISANETLTGAAALSSGIDGGMDLDLVIQDEEDNEDTAAAGMATDDFE